MRSQLQHEIYIRLSPDEKGLLCTLQYGPDYSRTTEYRVLAPEESLVPLKRPDSRAEPDQR